MRTCTCRASAQHLLLVHDCRRLVEECMCLTVLQNRYPCWLQLHSDYPFLECVLLEECIGHMLLYPVSRTLHVNFIYQWAGTASSAATCAIKTLRVLKLIHTASSHAGTRLQWALPLCGPPVTMPNPTLLAGSASTTMQQLLPRLPRQSISRYTFGACMLCFRSSR